MRTARASSRSSFEWTSAYPTPSSSGLWPWSRAKLVHDCSDGRRRSGNPPGGAQGKPDRCWIVGVQTLCPQPTRRSRLLQQNMQSWTKPALISSTACRLQYVIPCTLLLDCWSRSVVLWCTRSLFSTAQHNIHTGRLCTGHQVYIFYTSLQPCTLYLQK